MFTSAMILYVPSYHILYYVPSILIAFYKMIVINFAKVKLHHSSGPADYPESKLDCVQENNRLVLVYRISDRSHIVAGYFIVETFILVRCIFLL